jgi:hypothetical protein
MTLGKAPLNEWDLLHSNHHAFSVIRPCRQLRTSWCLEARMKRMNEIGKEPVIFCCLLPRKEENTVNRYSWP